MTTIVPTDAYGNRLTAQKERVSVGGDYDDLKWRTVVRLDGKMIGYVMSFYVGGETYINKWSASGVPGMFNDKRTAAVALADNASRVDG